jgi:hypothetical protein
MNEGIYNEFISPDILTIIKVCIFGMAWVCGAVGGERTDVTRKETRRREREKKGDLD